MFLSCAGNHRFSHRATTYRFFTTSVLNTLSDLQVYTICRDKMRVTPSHIYGWPSISHHVLRPTGFSHYWGPTGCSHYWGPTGFFHYWGPTGCSHYWGPTGFCHYWGPTGFFHYWGPTGFTTGFYHYLGLQVFTTTGDLQVLVFSHHALWDLL